MRAPGLTFLVGGARSGKSRLALRLAIASGRPVAVIATGAPGDDEMAERIRRHRAERPPSWTTIEEPRDLEAALAKVGADTTVIVDCLTLWVANLLGQDLTDDEIETRASAAAGLAAGHAGGAVVVSNEVGMGVVPANALARRYADLLGRVNATWAGTADRAFLVVAGRALRLDAIDG
ncbi:MAG: bifunctional adenosylcobinamide kinase/adenosylcobinamide-phosphate guanylyltransferase [Acidimicrobiales bacterium]